MQLVLLKALKVPLAYVTCQQIQGQRQDNESFFYILLNKDIVAKSYTEEPILLEVTFSSV